jgi:hypothetical protein
MTNQDFAVTGLMVALIIGSSFDTTAKWALYLGLFLLFGVWFTAYKNGSLSTFAQNVSKDLFPKASGGQ